MSACLTIEYRKLIIMKRVFVLLLALVGLSVVEHYILGEGFHQSTQSSYNFSSSGSMVPIEDAFEVHYIDVGQADSTLVMCDDKFMLIDGGKPEDSDLIYTYLKEHGVNEIEYMICSHAEEDHIGGLPAALNYAQVNNVFCPTNSFDSRAFKSLKKYLAEQNREIVIPKVGTHFSLGSAECFILAVNTLEDSPNNSSIVLRVDYGNTSFLFCGDAEKVVENTILDAGYDVNCTVLKVPHHGSNSSLSDRFLYEAMPKYGIISVGKENNYGHPTDDILAKLYNAGVEVYRTDLHGHIICRSDGQTVSFVVEKEQKSTEIKQIGNPEPENTINEIRSNKTRYILNTNTKKIHYPSCPSTNEISPKNMQESSLSKKVLSALGYSSCGRCKP